MRTLCVVSGARSDWGLYRPILDLVRRTAGLRLHLVLTGMHLSDRFGRTERLVRRDGFRRYDRVESLAASDDPAGIGRSMGNGIAGFSELFAKRRPDLLLVLGDRFEMAAAALAALPFMIPVAHVHGGELSEGAIDDALRHSMTKLSHLHFPATEAYAKRIRQLGEESWRIAVCGAPGLDHLRTTPIPNRATLERSLGRSLPKRFLLVTYHPVTLQYGDAARQIGDLLKAIDESGFPALFTMPNADTGGRVIDAAIRRYVAENTNSLVVDNLGTERYLATMRLAEAMVGNSSSGIIEAASFKLPVVNVGIRQRGRTHGVNVLDCDNSREAIARAIRRATSPAFRRKCACVKNPYDRGGAAKIVVQTLANVPINEQLIQKRFVDLS